MVTSSLVFRRPVGPPRDLLAQCPVNELTGNLGWGSSSRSMQSLSEKSADQNGCRQLLEFSLMRLRSQNERIRRGGKLKPRTSG